ncbi:MAG: hypothetical protein LBH68_05840 [Bifidobacteriaceae bacterium]|jgi:hypothetical protein|nr:hypothetical protein [Bifidobacteriaceae bacterium]
MLLGGVGGRDRKAGSHEQNSLPLAYRVGAVASVPGPTAREVRWHFPLVVAGGVIAPLVMAVVFIVVGVVVDEWTVWVMALIPLANAVATGVPMRFGAQSNDGMRFFALVRGGDAERVERIKLKIAAMGTYGQEMDLPADELDLLVKSDDPVARYMGLKLALVGAGESTDADQAGELAALIRGSRLLQRLETMSG